MKTNLIAYILLVSVSLVLGGCQDRPAPPPPAPDPTPEPPPPHPAPLTEQRCPPDCTVEIRLPSADEPGQAPHGFPDLFTIKENTDFEFLVSGTRARGAVVLSFAEPVVRRGTEQGQQSPWLYTVRLNPGNNAFTIRDYDAGKCHERGGGCKFVVINLGSPHQPSVIGSPRVVIDPH